MTIANRTTGWLNHLHQAKVRELLCHSLARYRIVCPAYCLMPDHGHFLLLGVSKEADQLRAVAHFRRAWNELLKQSEAQLQIQAHEHVLREHERQRDAFIDIANHIFENPARAEVAARWQDYPYLGAVVPGFPMLNPRDDDFWNRFWRIYNRVVTDG